MKTILLILGIAAALFILLAAAAFKTAGAAMEEFEEWRG